METILNKEKFLFKTVVALGDFDGVHIGHKTLMEKCAALAKEKNQKSVVYTFSESVKKVKRITNNTKKFKEIEKLGIDYIVVQEVTEEFLKTTPEDFVKTIIKERLNAEVVVVGKHYTFGHKGQAGIKELETLCRNEGIEVFVMPLIEIDDFLVSSTHIRFFIEYGEVDKAKKFLGRNFSIEGEIVHGRQIGHKIGFPTINIYFEENTVMPRYGVYATRVLINGKKFNGVANVGIKPTVGSDKPLVEVHLLNCEDKELYLKKAQVEFLKFIRVEQSFENLECLAEQINEDIKCAEEYFESEGEIWRE